MNPLSDIRGMRWKCSAMGLHGGSDLSLTPSLLASLLVEVVSFPMPCHMLRISRASLWRIEITEIMNGKNSLLFELFFQSHVSEKLLLQFISNAVRKEQNGFWIMEGHKLWLCKATLLRFTTRSFTVNSHYHWLSLWLHAMSQNISCVILKKQGHNFPLITKR